MTRPTSIIVGTLLAVLLVGCGAAGLLGLMKLIGLGYAVGELKSGFEGDDPATYRVYMDGYDIGSSPSANGNVNLNGLPEGVHLLSITSADKRRGWHHLLEIRSGQTTDLRQINVMEGAIIAGAVSRELTGGGSSPMTRALVVAIKDAADMLQSGGSGTIYLPPDSIASNLTYLVAYTDDQGQYRLGPAEYGDYIVLTAAAGYLSDAAYIEVSAGGDAAAVNLMLEPDSPQNPGRVSGAISVSPSGQVLLTTELNFPYRAPISTALRQRIEQQSGLQLTTETWFRLRTLATLSSDVGHYELDLPAGRHSLQAFKFGRQAKEVWVDIGGGGLTSQDFTL